MKPNPVSRALRDGGTSFGTMALEFASTGLARTAASAGAEFVIWDQEHTGFHGETIRAVLAAARASDVVPIVRVPASEPHHHATLALDLGAMGIMVPMVNGAAQARSVVDAIRYPPLGRRGFGVLYEDEHGGDLAGYCERANNELLTIVQIETAAALGEVGAIAAVEGIDVLWVGHFDLSVSLGIPGRFDHPDFEAGLDVVTEECRRHGKAAGMIAASPADGRRLLERGFRCLSYGYDLGLYRQALGDGIAALRSAAGPQPEPTGAATGLMARLKKRVSG